MITWELPKCYESSAIVLRNIAASCESVSKVLRRFFRSIAACFESVANVLQCESTSKVFPTWCESVARVVKVLRKCCERACVFVARDVFQCFFEHRLF